MKMNPVIATTSALLLVGATNAFAQHIDIDFEFHDGHIDILGSHTHDETEEGHGEGEEHGHSEEEHEHGALLLFESDFGDAEGGPFKTDAPGYSADPGALISGKFIGYNAVAPVLYHDGTGIAPTPGVAVITIEDGLGGTDVDITGSSFGGSGIIGESVDGSFHAHVDYEINSDAPLGAYLIELTLSAYDLDGSNPFTDPLILDPGIEDSQSFYILFNNGLSEIQFEEAHEAFEALVPEPGSALALIAGMGLIASRRRRR